MVDPVLARTATSLLVVGLGGLGFLHGFKGIERVEVIADAVRFGGGIGASGQPRWREGAKAYLNYKGFPSTLGGVTIRPAYAEWLAGNPATFRSDFAFVSLHTNAGGGRGTINFSCATSSSA